MKFSRMHKQLWTEAFARECCGKHYSLVSSGGMLRQLFSSRGGELYFQIFLSFSVSLCKLWHFSWRLQAAAFVFACWKAKRNQSTIYKYYHIRRSPNWKALGPANLSSRDFHRKLQSFADTFELNQFASLSDRTEAFRIITWTDSLERWSRENLSDSNRLFTGGYDKR